MRQPEAGGRWGCLAAGLAAQEPHSNGVAGRNHPPPPHPPPRNSVSEELFKFTKIVLGQERNFQGVSNVELQLLRFLLHSALKLLFPYLQERSRRSRVLCEDRI